MKTRQVDQLSLFLDKALPSGRSTGKPAKAVPSALRELLAVAESLRNSRPQGVPQEPDRAFVRSLKNRLLAEGEIKENEGVRYAWVKMPIGRLYYAYTQQGICATNRCQSDREFETYFAGQYGFRPVFEPTPPAALRDRVKAWVEHRPSRGRNLPQFDLSHVTDFERRVLELAAKIPRGEVRPYHWLAKEAGNPAASRAVGSVMAHNPIPFLIPCHRVVRADAHIGNYGCGGPEVKRWLLEWEGVKLDCLAEAAKHGARLMASDTTRIFCLPGCRHAQRVAPHHRVFFANARSAKDAGYRPCQSCRPV